jgi:hypothetical protein
MSGSRVESSARAEAEKEMSRGTWQGCPRGVVWVEGGVCRGQIVCKGESVVRTESPGASSAKRSLPRDKQARPGLKSVRAEENEGREPGEKGSVCLSSAPVWARDEYQTFEASDSMMPPRIEFLPSTKPTESIGRSPYLESPVLVIAVSGSRYWRSAMMLECHRPCPNFAARAPCKGRPANHPDKVHRADAPREEQHPEGNRDLTIEPFITHSAFAM